MRNRKNLRVPTKDGHHDLIPKQLVVISPWPAEVGMLVQLASAVLPAGLSRDVPGFHLTHQVVIQNNSVTQNNRSKVIMKGTVGIFLGTTRIAGEGGRPRVVVGKLWIGGLRVIIASVSLLSEVLRDREENSL